MGVASKRIAKNMWFRQIQRLPVKWISNKCGPQNQNKDSTDSNKYLLSASTTTDAPTYLTLSPENNNEKGLSWLCLHSMFCFCNFCNDKRVQPEFHVARTRRMYVQLVVHLYFADSSQNKLQHKELDTWYNCLTAM
jgi:hypothetical protein